MFLESLVNDQGVFSRVWSAVVKMVFAMGGGIEWQ
jgi:hypothetical protein